MILLSLVFISIVLCIFMSAFFSGSEMAFSAANQIRLENIAGDGNKKAKRTSDMIKRYNEILSSILIGNNLVNIASSSLTSVFVFLLTGSDRLSWLGTLILTVLIVVFGETIPKITAKHSATGTAMKYSGLLYAFDLLFKPVTWTVVKAVSILTLPLKGDGEEPSDSTEDSVEELQTIIETAEDEGILDSDDTELLQNAIDFAEIPATEAMTARVDVQALDIDDDWQTIIAVVENTPYSRLPVYKDSIDNIIGIVHLNVFLQHLIETNREPFDLQPILLKPCFVYKTMKLPSVLRQLKEAKQHLAIVTDEYSGTLGVITMEDVLEQVVGEIWDDTDTVTNLFTQLSSNSWAVDGDMSMSDFIELIGMEEGQLDCSSRTVGGWTIEQFEKYPAAGESFELGNLKVEVKETDGRRVDKVVVTLNKEGEEQ